MSSILILYHTSPSSLLPSINFHSYSEKSDNLLLFTSESYTSKRRSELTLREEMSSLNSHIFCLFKISRLYKECVFNKLFFSFFFKLSSKYMFINFREEEMRGTDRQTDRVKERQREKKHWSIAFYTLPNWGWNLQPRYVLWPGVKPETFWCPCQHCNQLSHPARANKEC